MARVLRALCLAVAGLPAATAAHADLASFSRHLANDFSTQAGYPFRLASQSPVRFSLGVAGIAALFATDPLTRDALASPSFVSDNGLRGPAEQISAIPSARNTVALVAGIGAIGLIANSPRERETSVMLTEAIVTSGVWTGALKLTAGRQRPRETDEYAADWSGPGAIFDDDNGGVHSFLSFPSGHTSGTFAVATVLAHQYPAHGVVPVLAYGGAAAMGYSRIVLGAHWLSDVAVGALLGYGCASQVIHAHENRDGGDAHNEWHLGIDFQDGHRGVSLTRRF